MGLGFVARRHPRVPPAGAAAGAGSGLVLLLVAVGYLGTSVAPVIAVTLLAAAVVAMRLAGRWRLARVRRAPAAEEHADGAAMPPSAPP